MPKFIARNDSSSKNKQQFWLSRANMRQLVIESMDDEIPPAPGRFPFPFPSPSPSHSHSPTGWLTAAVGVTAKIYSVGEEQGPGYAKEVCWSPLGAARYGRCLLAVVATNHRLYVFEPVGHVECEMRVAHELTPMMCHFGSTDRKSVV